MAVSKKTVPATAWKRLEKAALQKLGKHAAGRYAAELEPRVMPFATAFDSAPLLPPEYVQFVKALGYRWMSTGTSALAFLPPRWMLGLSQQMGEPGRKWETVRAEREAGTHAYEFVMFASRDIDDVNGFCFGLKTLPPVLFRMPWLRTLDLYWTTISPEEIERLRRALPDCKVGVS
ncbi:hypothetical protein [Archangium violaceum]|uniref:Uncharacterized protein n=1 Tax=Archangium violaceum Cb vi76 TaxID=1406225 RepID=A0A084SUN1_9BACT|nr:hypothetical protein [Archangium violaceum]KFA92166.1 hypothetical protein Q664_17890 [Archangium violaceum Cb vi76]